MRIFFRINSTSVPINNTPFKITVRLNEKLTRFELDTGSYISTISHSEAVAAGGKIHGTDQKAIAYGGADIDLIGETKLHVSYNGKTIYHSFLVVDTSEVNLFGRDLCNVFDIKLSIPSCNKIHTMKHKIFAKHADYLSEDFKSCVTQKVSLNVLPDSSPIFSKSRSVPFRMKSSVKSELDRLVSEGTITKVNDSRWASPTVNVMKKNGTIRICGDFSSTVNKYLDPVPYP